MIKIRSGDGHKNAQLHCANYEIISYHKSPVSALISVPFDEPNIVHIEALMRGAKFMLDKMKSQGHEMPARSCSIILIEND